MNKKIKISLAIALMLSVIPGLPVFADPPEEVSPSPTSSVSATPGAKADREAERKAKLAGLEAQRKTKIKERASREISRRITALTNLSSRIGAMKRVSGGGKGKVSTDVTAQIKLLNDLKAKIDAGEDIATLREDVKSITGSYRIFALVIPQGRITAAADRVRTVIGLITTAGGKIETRIAEAKTKGADVSGADALVTDYKAKLAHAEEMAKDAETKVSGLSPDKADTATLKANKDALKSAHESIKSAETDLKTAREDLKKIVEILKLKKETKVKASTSPSPSVSATPTN